MRVSDSDYWPKLVPFLTFASSSLPEFSKQVKQKVSNTTLRVQNLEEEVTYTFTVRAQTTVDYGPGVSENVTTGPQDGSPVAPRDLILTKTLSSVEMHWINGPSGRGPILGYLVEAKKRGKWPALSPPVVDASYSHI